MKRQISPSKSTIANQCPLSGGKSVFQARSLLVLIGQIIRYNDRDICGAAGIQIRQQQIPKGKIENVIKVFPNPASDLVTVEYHFIEKGNYSLLLFNTLGKQQGAIKLESLHGSTSFSTSHLPPGLYYYRVQTRNDLYDSGKLLIIR